MVQGITGTVPGLESSLHAAQSGRETTAARISSGSALNSAADNPAGLAIANRLLSQSNGFQQAIGNAVDGISRLQGEGAVLSSVADALQCIRELSLQSANGILTDSDRGALQSEARQLQQGISGQFENAEFNGRKLFADTGNAAVQLADNGAIELGGRDFSAAGVSLNNLDISTVQGARTALGSVDPLLQDIDSRQGELGAISARIDSAVNNLYASAANSEQARSQLQDSDLASEASENISAGIAQQVGLALQAQANTDSRRVLQLLGA
ncbi:MAG: flagellin [Paraglaciecola psychrophila]|jgi:flagellin